ncbi:MAG TPA: SDR family oxidoreductase, partial [Ramlibacter sp.]|uniref:SDR family oxidoreductase n=1 Tax=Ramlibacter sp. TaxID=1917967 RepID=UPI002D7F7465
MPSNQNPLGALPGRFRRQRVLVIGCGDVGLRVARALPSRVRVLGLTSSPGRVPQLRERGIVPVQGNLDQPATLARLAGVADRIVHLAPPATEPVQHWWRDHRTQALLRALSLRSVPAALVYASTSGVYGDCGGEMVAEHRAVAPHTPRAQRRVDAERLVRHFGRVSGTRASVLRIPGIYANDRVGGTPRERLEKGTPVLQASDDVYTNHIHADDLARAVVAALWRGRPQRVYHVSDDSALKMGDYFDLAADLYGLPRPPRVPRSTAQDSLPLVLLSFMSESRRLENARLKSEL